MRVAIVGAGWAGLSAAVRAVEAGHEVTVYEAGRVSGGRARAVVCDHPVLPDHTLDNGQHILIAAYTDTLRVMRHVGVNPDLHLRSLPLTLTYPDGNGLQLPDWPAWASPADVVAGIASAGGWTWRDKLALARVANGWQRAGFQCPDLCSVAELCATLPPTVYTGFIEPLCVSALNTPARQASAQVFLRVLHDALFGTPGGSRLLLPTTNLGALFPRPAQDWLLQHGAAVHTGERVAGLRQEQSGWAVVRPHGKTDRHDHVILATPAAESCRLLLAHTMCTGASSRLQIDTWAAVTGALHFEAIATVYALGESSLRQPMVSLRPTHDRPAQFVFDRSRLGGPAGLLAFVVSASQGDRALLETQVQAQATEQLGQQVRPVQTIVEKRATFACTPGLQRPPSHICAGLSACGDYVQGPYPATLEGAVRSGWSAGAL